MGVYIMGLKMPKNCFECPFAMSHFKTLYTMRSNFSADYSCVITHKALTSTKRNRFCPLVEVQPHCRLIDADALTDCLATMLQFPSTLVNGQWIVNTLREQPIIIDAEE